MIYANSQLIRGPSLEPVDLATAEGWHRVNSDNGGPVDQDFTALITLARQRCETVLRRALYTQVWKLSLKNWPGRDYQNWPAQGASLDIESYHKHNFIELPYPPLQGVFAVAYLDTSAVSWTMRQVNAAGGYNVDFNFEPGRVVLPFSQVWPTTILLPGAPISILYAGGYQDGTGIGTLTLGGPMAGYQVGDLVGITVANAYGGLIQVTAVSSSGSIAACNVVIPGTGYAVASGLATSGGSGTGATASITALAPENLSTAFEGYSSVVQAMKMMIGYCYENKIPPSEMRRSSIDAGLQYVMQQLLEEYRIH